MPYPPVPLNNGKNTSFSFLLAFLLQPTSRRLLISTHASSLAANFTPTIHTDTYPAISSVSQSNLIGKSVFISGASQGIGHATALSYARAGAAQIAVTITARSGLEKLEQEILAAAATASPNKRNPPPKVLVLSLNVLDHESVKAAAQATEEAFGGKLDILINNAGYLEHGIPIADSDPDDYWRTWEINYRGLYWMTKAFLPLLLRADNEAGLKTIVNVSSMGALALRRGGSSYQTTKFAMLKFTEFVMAEYADQGILCYAVHPGGVMTKLGSNMPKETHNCTLCLNLFYVSVPKARIFPCMQVGRWLIDNVFLLYSSP